MICHIMGVSNIRGVGVLILVEGIRALLGSYRRYQGYQGPCYTPYGSPNILRIAFSGARTTFCNELSFQGVGQLFFNKKGSG